MMNFTIISNPIYSHKKVVSYDNKWGGRIRNRKVVSYFVNPIQHRGYPSSGWPATVSYFVNPL